MHERRLLALTTSYPLDAAASAGVFIDRLYCALSARWTIEVVCPADRRHRPATSARSPGLSVHAVRYAPARWRVLAQQAGGVMPALHAAPWRALLLLPLLAGLAWCGLRRARACDLIHANWAVCGAIAGIVGRLRGKPVVTTLRGDDVTRARGWGMQRLVLGLAVRLSDRLVCVSQAMAEELKARYPHARPRVHVVQNGVHEEFFATRRNHPPGVGTLRLAAAGSLIPRKGFDLLIEALARARTQSKLRLRIAGEGPQRRALEALAERLGVRERIEFAGALAPAAMPAFFAAADVFVLPSRAEGRPNVVLEALASGLPVISAELPGVSDLVQPGIHGWLFTVGSAEALARALEAAAEDPERLRAYARAAGAHARRVLGSWTDTARAYEAIFTELVALAAVRTD
jgi:glycosyltransferase involved in cell wall biosynthesis